MDTQITVILSGKNSSSDTMLSTDTAPSKEVSDKNKPSISFLDLVKPVPPSHEEVPGSNSKTSTDVSPSSVEAEIRSDDSEDKEFSAIFPEVKKSPVLENDIEAPRTKFLEDSRRENSELTEFNPIALSDSTVSKTSMFLQCEDIGSAINNVEQSLSREEVEVNMEPVSIDEPREKRDVRELSNSELAISRRIERSLNKSLFKPDHIKNQSFSGSSVPLMDIDIREIELQPSSTAEAPKDVGKLSATLQQTPIKSADYPDTTGKEIRPAITQNVNLSENSPDPHETHYSDDTIIHRSERRSDTFQVGKIVESHSHWRESDVSRFDSGRNLRQISTTIIRETSDHYEIQLDPPELGRVKIGLENRDGALSVHIQTDRLDTAGFIRRNHDFLEKTFLQLGYEGVTFRYSSGDSPSQQRNQGGNSSLFESGPQENSSSNVNQESAENSKELPSRLSSRMEIRI
ncbi:flagellar hook-length control protein FliK [Mangrovicoccus sp. HB161399]|uniref:flagellar hook-length control protein FliK n=1 Tax=Mangrovicoccus sp. HB161399 TaxID=2720392 RepID=UPI0015524601|nr:flagellar hook-length control protein FliK [Mangrovicoccus sp. HB161399]